MRDPGYRGVGGYRFLRSDGKPNYANRVYRVERDMEFLSSHPPITGKSTTPVIEAFEKMYEKNVRSLIITGGNEVYEGALLVEHLMSYLGGGEYYNIVLNKYDDDFHKTMNEPVRTIFSRDYAYVNIWYKLPEVISVMVENDLFILPVLRKDRTVYGVISEHDIVSILSEKHTSVKAKEIMSSTIVSVESMDPLLNALRVMCRTGLRRVFVKNEVGQLIGVLNANTIVKYYGSHLAYKYMKKGFLTDTTSIPVKDLMLYRVVRVDSESDIGEISSKMIEEDIGAVIVEDEGEDAGMITEHDIFFALAVAI